MIRVISIGPWKKFANEKLDILKIMHRFRKGNRVQKEDRDSFATEFRRRALKVNDIFTPRAMLFIYDGNKPTADAWTYNSEHINMKVFQNLGQALELHDQGLVKVLEGKTDDDNYFYEENNLGVTPDDKLLLFVYLRYRYLSKDKIESISLLTTRSINRIEKLAHHDIGHQLLYCQLVTALIDTTSTLSIKDVYDRYIDTMDLSYITDIQYTPVEGIPDDWIKWGHNNYKNKVLMTEYRAKRKAVKLSQYDLSLVAGITQSNISLLESKHSSSPINFIKYCYNITLAEQQQQAVV